MHSGITRTPLWAAEFLTADRIAAASQLPRRNAFHPETKIPACDRAELADYARSGYDRGHMSPNHDMPTPTAQRESFFLANIVPQAPKINQNLWEGIETAVRTLVSNDHDLYVITGSLFESSEAEQLNGCVLVPSSVFKAIYDPGRHEAGAYVTMNEKNSRTMQYDAISIEELERRAGINLFPMMSITIKQVGMDLPAPAPHGHP